MPQTLCVESIVVLRACTRKETLFQHSPQMKFEVHFHLNSTPNPKIYAWLTLPAVSCDMLIPNTGQYRIEIVIRIRYIAAYDLLLLKNPFAFPCGHRGLILMVFF